MLALWMLVALLAHAAGASVLPGGWDHALASRQEDGVVVDASSFLRRAWHSSAVVDHRLYIDGGEVSYLTGGAPVYTYSNSLVSIDLTRDWTNDSVTLLSSPKPPGVPSLRNGGIWVNGKTGALYTGFAGTNSRFGEQTPSPQGLWSFTPDHEASGTWESLNETTDGWFTTQARPSGALVTSGRGHGFLFGGTVDNGTGPQTAPWSFVTYDFESKTLVGQTMTWGPHRDMWGVFNGTVYVPNWGSRGILIALGQTPTPSPNVATAANSFQTIHVYDIGNDTWYEQQPTGDVPDRRQDFCIAGAPSSNDTFEILVYGGWTGKAGDAAVPLDSAYVLTLPGFHWVRADYPAAYPRHGQSCNAVGGGQILTIGGVDSTQRGGDGIDAYAAGFASPDPFAQGLAVFDLTTLSWSPRFLANRGVQPFAPQIQAYYDTNSRAPANNFSSPDLATLFATADFTQPEPPSSPIVPSHHRPRHDRHVAAIVASTISGAVAVAIATWLFVYPGAFRRKRDRERERRVSGRWWWLSQDPGGGDEETGDKETGDLEAGRKQDAGGGDEDREMASKGDRADDERPKGLLKWFRSKKKGSETPAKTSRTEDDEGLAPLHRCWARQETRSPASPASPAGKRHRAENDEGFPPLRRCWARQETRPPPGKRYRTEEDEGWAAWRALKNLDWAKKAREGPGVFKMRAVKSRQSAVRVRFAQTDVEYEVRPGVDLEVGAGIGMEVGPGVGMKRPKPFRTSPGRLPPRSLSPSDPMEGPSTWWKAYEPKPPANDSSDSEEEEYDSWGKKVVKRRASQPSFDDEWESTWDGRGKGKGKEVLRRKVPGAPPPKTKRSLIGLPERKWKPTEAELIRPPVPGEEQTGRRFKLLPFLPRAAAQGKGKGKDIELDPVSATQGKAKEVETTPEPAPVAQGRAREVEPPTKPMPTLEGTGQVEPPVEPAPTSPGKGKEKEVEPLTKPLPTLEGKEKGKEKEVEHPLEPTPAPTAQGKRKTAETPVQPTSAAPEESKRAGQSVETKSPAPGKGKEIERLPALAPAAEGSKTRKKAEPPVEPPAAAHGKEVDPTEPAPTVKGKGKGKDIESLHEPAPTAQGTGEGKEAEPPVEPSPTAQGKEKKGKEIEPAPEPIPATQVDSKEKVVEPPIEPVPATKGKGKGRKTVRWKDVEASSDAPPESQGKRKEKEVEPPTEPTELTAQGKGKGKEVETLVEVAPAVEGKGKGKDKEVLHPIIPLEPAAKVGEHPAEPSSAADPPPTAASSSVAVPSSQRD